MTQFFNLPSFTPTRGLMWTLLSLLSIFGGDAATALARITPLHLERAARTSHSIVIVSVKRIVTVGGKRMAEAQVLETIAGMLTTGEKILFIAEPLWAEDLSTAKEGERSLLMLSKLDLPPGLTAVDRDALHAEVQTRYQGERKLFVITHHGRCRFPIKRQQGQHWVDLSLCRGLSLPPDLKPKRQPLSVLTAYLVKVADKHRTAGNQLGDNPYIPRSTSARWTGLSQRATAPARRNSSLEP